MTLPHGRLKALDILLSYRFVHASDSKDPSEIVVLEYGTIGAALISQYYNDC